MGSEDDKHDCGFGDTRLLDEPRKSVPSARTGAAIQKPVDTRKTDRLVESLQLSHNQRAVCLKKTYNDSLQSTCGFLQESSSVYNTPIQKRADEHNAWR